MDTHSVETDQPSAQAPLVPDRMNLVADWKTDSAMQVWFELWADRQRGDGLILANAEREREFRPVGDVEISGRQLAVVWKGPITDRPAAWLNAQRAQAEYAYFGHRR